MRRRPRTFVTFAGVAAATTLALAAIDLVGNAARVPRAKRHRCEPLDTRIRLRMLGLRS